MQVAEYRVEESVPEWSKRPPPRRYDVPMGKSAREVRTLSFPALKANQRNQVIHFGNELQVIHFGNN